MLAVTVRKVRLLAIIAGAASGLVPAAAEVDRSPPPGGVYRLKPGTFVTKGVDCAKAANVDTKFYDGRGIATAHTRACNARVLSKRPHGYGYIFRVSQSCIDSGEGPGRRFTERQTVEVPDALTFRIISQGDTTYTYCPIRELRPRR